MKRLALSQKKNKINCKHCCPKIYSMPIPDGDPQNNEVKVKATASFSKQMENIAASRQPCCGLATAAYW